MSRTHKRFVQPRWVAKKRPNAQADISSQSAPKKVKEEKEENPLKSVTAGKTVTIAQREEKLMMNCRLQRSEFVNQCYRNGMSAHLEFLDFNYEHILLKHYAFQIRKLFNNVNHQLPKHVLGNCLQMYHRFYNKSAVMQYHPRCMSHACAFVACQQRNKLIDIDMFLKYVPMDHKESIDECKQQIVNYAEVLRNSLNFAIELNPFKEVQSAISLMKAEGVDGDYRQLAQETYDVISSIMMTNLMLLFPPKHIAVAALLAAADSGKVRVDKQKLHVFAVSQGNNVIGIKEHLKKRIKENNKVEAFVLEAIETTLEQIPQLSEKPATAEELEPWLEGAMNF